MSKKLRSLAPFISFVIMMPLWYVLDISHLDPEIKSKFRVGFESFFVGILIQTLVELLYQRHELREERSLQHKFLETLNPRIQRQEDVSHLNRFFGRDLNSDEVTQAWRDLLYRLRGNYSATNYIREIYGTDWAKAALCIQNAKKTEGSIIKKVFLIEDDKEIERDTEYLDEQKRIGIEIHFLPMHEVKADPALWSPIKSGSILSPDFGIFEDRYILVWKLQERVLTNGELLMGDDIVRRHQQWFDRLFRKAAEYNRERVVPVLLSQKTIDKISHWPAYKEPYQKMDYALRRPGGWLYNQGATAGCKRFGWYADGTLIGFSLLVPDAKGGAEFYVAVHQEHLRQGFGKKITEGTLAEGFESHLKTIHLKVRTDYEFRIQMYRNCGFRDGEKFSQKIDPGDHEEVKFLKMTITAGEHKALSDAKV